MPGRTESADSMTLHSMMPYDHMDPEVRLQIQSNIRVLYGPSTAEVMNIATSQHHAGNFLAFIVKQDHLIKSLNKPQTLAGVPKPTRSAAMLSLLEATEQRIFDTLSTTKHAQSSGANSPKKTEKSSNENHSRAGSTVASTVPSPEPKIISVPSDDRAPVDTVSVASVEKPLSFAEKAKERGFRALYFKRHIRFDPPMERNVD